MNPSISLSSARVAAISKQALLAALGVTALSLFSLGASAEAWVSQQQVSFSDLDLSKPQDAKRLYGRLQSASQEVCSTLRRYDDLRSRQRFAKCVDRALTNAIATIGHPSLTALHTEKSEMKLAQRGQATTPRS